MSEIFNDQLTDPSSSSIFNSTSQYTNSYIGDTISNMNLKNENKIQNTFDTQVIENINTNNPIKITENFESLDPFQYSADTYSQNATIKQTISTDSKSIVYKQFHQLPSRVDKSECNQYKEYLENQSQSYLQNDSYLSQESMTSQSVSKIISDDESDLNSEHFKVTKNLSNQRFETFPDGEIIEGSYERLDLSKNELSRMNKPIPNGIKQLILNENRFAFLTNLKGNSLNLIELKDNRLISVQGIKSCINLKHLDLSNNFLSDDQLDELKELKELEILLIKHNHLKNESIIDSFSTNKKLKVLDLSQNDIEDIVIRENCYVKRLNLQQNKIESFKVLALETNECKTKPKILIQRIDISQNGLQYFDAKQLISLRELLLQDNQLLDLDLSNNYKIKKVNLNRNQLSSIKFKDNELYPLMKRLLISNNRIIKISFISYHLQALEELDVSNNNIDDHKHFFDNISKLKNLMKLNMEGNPFDEEAKLIQISLEQKGNKYLQESNGQPNKDQIYKKENSILNEAITTDQYQTKDRDSKIFNSHFTSISNGKMLKQFNSLDNNSNLLNGQLSPDLFNSIDQQFMTQKSEGQQSVDQSMQFNKKKNKEESHSNQNYNEDNNESMNQSELWSNQYKNDTKGIYSIHEEDDDEQAIKESSQKLKEYNSQQKSFSEQIFESNLFKKKMNQQSDDKQFYESEAKILNDHLNFSINEEDEFSSKNLQSMRNELSSEQIGQRNQFRKKNASNETKLNDTSENNSEYINSNQQRKSAKQSQRNKNEKENYNAYIQERERLNSSSSSQKENNINFSNKTFNDLDEEEKQLKLAIETMESSLTDGSLLSEITNEMTKEYRKNLNQLKEYYKDRKCQKTFRKEDGETLLQINQTLMQKIITKLGDDPALQRNPYFLKCKQLIQQNYETFEPSSKINSKIILGSQKESNINLSQRQTKKSNTQRKSDQSGFSYDYESMCSPKFQINNQFNETLLSSQQNHSIGLEKQNEYNQFNQLKQQNQSSPSQQLDHQQVHKQSKIPEYVDDINYQNSKKIHSQNSSNTLPRQMNSLMSTQEQNSIFSNNQVNLQKSQQQKYKDQQQQQHQQENYRSHNNSSYSINNNSKTLNLFDTTTNYNEQQQIHSIFTDTSLIPAAITNQSPFINRDNKRLYSQSSRLPTSEIEQYMNMKHYQQQNQTCRIASKERNSTQNFTKKTNNSSQQFSNFTQNNESNFSIGVSEDEFFRVFQEYLLSDDFNENKQKNRNCLTIRKKFIKLIIREVLSNCDLYYSTQIIDQIIQSILPYIQEQENVRFDKLYSLFIKTLYSQIEQSNNITSEQSPINNSDSQQNSHSILERKNENIHDFNQSDQEHFEERIKTPPQIITFRRQLREGSMEKKFNNTRHSNTQSLSSNSRLTSENLQTNGNLTQQQHLNDIESQLLLFQQQQNTLKQQRQLSPITNNSENQQLLKQQTDNSLYLPNTQQILLSGDNSFLSTNNKKLIPNEKSNASFEIFLQKNKFNSNLQATPKTSKSLKNQNINLCLTFEDVYSQVTPYIKYILEKSSAKSQQRQSSPYSRDSPLIKAQSIVKQIDQNNDEYQAVGQLLLQLRFEIHRVAKSQNYQANQIQQAKQQKIIKQINLEESNRNKLASYINNKILFFNDYLILFHSTELQNLGKILETSFLQFYGEYPTVFSLKKDIANYEQDKYQKKRRFNISTQNQTHTNTSMFDGSRSKWRIIAAKVYLGKCLIDQVNTIESFNLDNSLEYIIEQSLFLTYCLLKNFINQYREGYQSVFLEKSDAYMLFDNQLATPLYLCEYYNYISQ